MEMKSPGARNKIEPLAYDGFHPRVFRKHVDDAEQIPVALVVLGQALHFHQIGRPLLVGSEHGDGGRGKPTSRGFLQGIAHVALQEGTRSPRGDASRLGKPFHAPQTARLRRIPVLSQQGRIRDFFLFLLLLHTAVSTISDSVRVASPSSSSGTSGPSLSSMCTSPPQHATKQRIL